MDNSALREVASDVRGAGKVKAHFIVGRGVIKKLNRLNVSLFTPSLLFSKVAFFLSPERLSELWITPIFFVVTTLVSMATAYLPSILLGLKKSQRSFAIAASMFMNSNSLPIALMQSLVVTVPGLKWHDNDNKNAMVGRARTYLVLYSTLCMVVRWSYGVRLLSQADPEPVRSEAEDAAEAAEASPLVSPQEVPFPPSSAEDRILRHEPSSSTIGSDNSQTVAQGQNPGLSVQEVNGRKFFYSFPNTPSSRSAVLPHASTSGVTTDYDSDDSDGDDVLPPGRRTRTTPTSSKWQSRMRRGNRRIGKAFKTFRKFMTVPLWAALTSLVVACVQPLQHALEVHLPPIKNAISSLSNCSIPITLVVLGAYFYTPPDPEQDGKVPRSRLPEHHEPARNRSHASLFESVREMFTKSGSGANADRSLGASAKKEMRPGETKTVMVAILSRMIITPLLLLPVMTLSTLFDVQKVFDDPVFVVSNVLLIASPPALTLAQITQAASGDVFERLISRTIFWSYCVVTPPSTILFVVIGLFMSKL
ncbi:membrane transport protein-domain-containing protein [Daedaleopsis nitida]|nr:membrane transport protein-domain-containing protein [Daedaleopsis nitida]